MLQRPVRLSIEDARSKIEAWRHREQDAKRVSGRANYSGRLRCVGPVINRNKKGTKLTPFVQAFRFLERRRLVTRVRSLGRDALIELTRGSQVGLGKVPAFE